MKIIKIGYLFAAIILTLTVCIQANENTSEHIDYPRTQNGKQGGSKYFEDGEDGKNGEDAKNGQVPGHGGNGGSSVFGKGGNGGNGGNG